jgi:hypothetical protein
MLDNGYVYLAAARLSLFRSPTDWALVTEVFGFSPRSELPDVHVQTYGSALDARDSRDQYVSREAHESYLAKHPNNESRFFHPLDEGAWLDEEDPECLQHDASHCCLRSRSIAIPDRAAYEVAGITLVDPARVHVFELCRYLASTFRDDVLATPAERRTSILPDMVELLTLDDWIHPDLVNGQLPSATDAFQQLARVLETGDLQHYRPSAPGNTHWKNWPDGGSL